MKKREVFVVIAWSLHCKYPTILILMRQLNINNVNFYSSCCLCAMCQLKKELLHYGEIKH